MLARGDYEPRNYVLLWLAVFAANGAFILFLKGKSEGAQSFIDRQTFALWNTFVAAMVLVAVDNYLLGIRAMLFMRVFAISTPLTLSDPRVTRLR